MPLTTAAENRLRTALERYNELEAKLSEADVVNDSEALGKLSREFSTLTTIKQAHTVYEESLARLNAARADREADADPDMCALYDDEIAALETAIPGLEQNLTDALFPEENVSNKKLIIEIRAGTGGLEAALFAGDLFRMYGRYSEIKRWKFEMLSEHVSPMGGFKEICFAMSGENAFRLLRYESGVHRVQRIPATESGGRIHTSAATVAVLIEPDEVDVQIDTVDLRIDTYRSSSAGGQHVNKTDSAVRITHLPTGVVVECQDERSQHQNKAKAMRLLRARLLQFAQQQQHDERARDRKSQVGSGDRSERIRTYNFPQNRVSDHSAGVNLYKLGLIIEGDLDELLNQVQEYFKQNSSE